MLVAYDVFTDWDGKIRAGLYRNLEFPIQQNNSNKITQIPTYKYAMAYLYVGISSYPDYIGKKNFPSVTERNFLLEIMGGEQSCRNFVADWIRYNGEIREFAELALNNITVPHGVS